MNKEQFKISLVNLFNYYITNMINYNLEAKEAGDDEGITSMIQMQANALTVSFEQSLDKLIDDAFVEVENEDTVLGESDEPVDAE
jgi:hypothetical protein